MSCNGENARAASRTIGSQWLGAGSDGRCVFEGSVKGAPPAEPERGFASQALRPSVKIEARRGRRTSVAAAEAAYFRCWGILPETATTLGPFQRKDSHARSKPFTPLVRAA